MVSKKILAVVTVCIAILLVTVAIYAYIQITNTTDKTFNFSWDGDYVCANNKTIAYNFGVTTLRMSVTFERTSENNLTITVKTNHLRYNETYHGSFPDYPKAYSYVDYVGIAFDTSHDGELDEDDIGVMYYAHHYSLDLYRFRYAFLNRWKDGQIFFGGVSGSTFNGPHTAAFDAQQGYTYVIPINIHDVIPDEGNNVFEDIKLNNDLIHIEYDHAVAVDFHFGLEV